MNKKEKKEKSLYARYKDINNPLARGEIRRVYSSLTPEKQKAFKEYAASQNHDWGDLIK